MKFVVHEGKTGFIKKDVFSEIFTFKLTVDKIVNGDVNGVICNCTPSTDPRSRFVVFINSTLYMRPEKLQLQLCKASKVPLMVLANPKQLSQFLNQITYERIEEVDDIDEISLQYTDVLGRQVDGSFVFSDAIQLRRNGEMRDTPKYYLADVQGPIPRIHVPFSEYGGRDLYANLKEALPRRTYLSGLFAGGAILMNHCYSRIMTTFDRVPICLLSGNSNTGKTLMAKSALSLIGLQDTAIYRFMTLAKAKETMSSTTLPYTVNDVDSYKAIIDAIGLTFEAGIASNAHKSISPRTAPLFTCNRYIVEQIPRDHDLKELSRIVFVPFTEQIQDDVGDIKELLQRASSGLGEMIRAEDHISANEVKRITRGLKEACPTSCGSRLPTNYAIHMTKLFAEIVDPGSQEDILPHFHDVLLEYGIKPYQSTTDVTDKDLRLFVNLDDALKADNAAEELPSYLKMTKVKFMGSNITSDALVIGKKPFMRSMKSRGVIHPKGSIDEARAVLKTDLHDSHMGLNGKDVSTVAIKKHRVPDILWEGIRDLLGNPQPDATLELPAPGDLDEDNGSHDGDLDDEEDGNEGEDAIIAFNETPPKEATTQANSPKGKGMKRKATASQAPPTSPKTRRRQRKRNTDNPK